MSLFQPDLPPEHDLAAERDAARIERDCWQRQAAIWESCANDLADRDRAFLFAVLAMGAMLGTLATVLAYRVAL